MGNSVLWNLVTARRAGPVVAAGLAVGFATLIGTVGWGLVRDVAGK